MMLSPNFIQGVSMFIATELLVSLMIFKTLRPDDVSLYVREIGVIIMAASIPTLIYLTIYYITKVVLLITVFATLTISHVTILMRSEQEYVDSGAAAILGFIVGTFLFGWGVLAGILVFIASKFYKLKIEVPPQARIGLIFMRTHVIVGLFFLNLIVTYLAFGGVL